MASDSAKVHALNYVNGAFVESASGGRLDSVEPATGVAWASVPDSDADDVDAAVRAAEAAFPTWSSWDAARRAAVLRSVADLLEQRIDDFALAESRDQGKPVWLARAMDIPRAVLNFRCFSDAWTHVVEGSNVMPDVGAVNYSVRTPIGVAGLIAPWNLPLYLLTFKLAPALMAGNTVVCKPSEMTSVTAWMLAQLFEEVGVPKGVVNVVCGLGPKAGEALVKHPKVRIVSFTGSTMVGERIASIAAPMMKKLSLELGGKNAALVFGDADLEKAVPTLIRSCFLNQGEICLCTSRLFVHESIYETLVDKLVAATKKLQVGDPNDKDSFVGAINSKQHYEKVRQYIKYAVEDGGSILCGEASETEPLALPEKLRKGFFLKPTIIAGLADDSRCMQDEIFGPVVCVTAFSDEADVVRRANDVRYGLCASVWSENVGVVHRVSAGLHVGTVWANCWLVRSLDMPFGGCKASGLGREGTIHSLEAYTEEKTICIKIA